MQNKTESDDGSSHRQRIQTNLIEVRRRIAEAALRSGRSSNDVRLVAVVKYVQVEQALILAQAGCRDLAESRPQKLWEMTSRLQQLDQAPSVNWHLVGHLQRNKVHRTLPLVSLIHSVDSPRLLTALEQSAVELGRDVKVFLEVNVSHEPAKHGFAMEEISPVLRGFDQWPHVFMRGLMAMAGLSSGPDGARREFAALRELREQLRKEESPANVDLVELSMGMSNDYEIAIEEGATIVRVGSALFEGVD